MNEYWKKVLNNALDVLAELYGDDVGNNAAEVDAAVGYAFKHHDCMHAARAVGAQTDWRWAHHEIAAHAL